MIKNLKIFFLLILLIPIDLYSQENFNKSNLEKVYVGYSIQLFSNVDISDATVSIKMLGNIMANEVSDKYFAETCIYKNNDDIIKSFNNKTLDVVSLLSLDYFELKDQLGLIPYLFTGINNSPGHEFLVLIRKDSKINDIKDLNKKSIILPENNYGRLAKVWFETSLFDSGISNIETFFSKIKYADKPTQAVLPVFFKSFDACIVSANYFNTMCDLNPQLKNELKVLAKSPFLINGLITIRKNLKSEVQDVFREIGLKISNSTSGKQLLSLFGAKQLLLFEQKDFEETVKLYEKYKSIKK